jgi:hypothetical protein
MPFKMPVTPSKLTGKTRARCVGWKETVSKMDGQPQVQFMFVTERGNTFNLYMNINSLKAVDTFLNAGILHQLSEGEFDIVGLHSQPFLWVTLKEGKLVAFAPIG